MFDLVYTNQISEKLCTLIKKKKNLIIALSSSDKGHKY